MKTKSLKAALFATLLVAGMTLTSCKDKAETEGTMDGMDTTTTTSSDYGDMDADTTGTAMDTTGMANDSVNPVGP